ncbi:aspartate-semialdehyde dehydrogenase [Membranihabitans marinus]|uniref:aspartate-semialdehyde dehydrogenase n=1 Tax=Membranihabitans marinus TaxID=1227546 RepID=UPI001F00FFAF|nr:aspartate-semialdehyde dehydrogenase [Membranihabitans marinus]
MKLAVVGITGMVGTEICKVLEEYDFPYSELLPVASEKSIGKQVEVKGKSHSIIGLEEAVSLKPDIAIFSAGGQTSLDWAPKFAEVGTIVIDNSSAWRMDPTKKLVVPEINADTITAEDKIIANPNCSTIQMVLALSNLHKRFGIKRLVISTYQSITGTGVKAVRQYEAEKKGEKVADPAYPHPIFDNCIPHCDVFLDNHYTKEEMKLVNETQKILGDNNIKITATAIRVPVHGGHSESVNVEFNQGFEIDEVIDILAQTEGVEVQNDHANQEYPMALYAKGKNSVYVGRIRRDDSIENGLNMWIVADNLRKGAATNAVQIANYIYKNSYVTV